jgi:hypothetical protein
MRRVQCLPPAHHTPLTHRYPPHNQFLPCQAWWPPLVASARVARVAAEERGLQCSNMKDVKGYKLAMKDGESCWLQWAHLALLSTEAAVLNPCRRSFRYSFQPFQPTQPLQNNQQQVDPNSGRRGDLWSSFVNYRQSVIYCQSTRLCGAESFLGHKPLFIKDMWSSLVKRTLVKACIVLVYSILLGCYHTRRANLDIISETAAV